MSDILDRTIDGIIGSFNETILPSLTDEFARGQVFAAIYLLSEMKTRADWGEGWLREHLAIQIDAFTKIGLTPAEGISPPPFERVPDGLGAGELARLRDEGDRYLYEIQREIDAVPRSAEIERIQAAVGEAVRAQAALEVRLTPKPMYSKVARG